MYSNVVWALPNWDIATMLRTCIVFTLEMEYTARAMMRLALLHLDFQKILNA